MAWGQDLYPKGTSWQRVLRPSEKLVYVQAFLSGYSRGYIQRGIDGGDRLGDWKHDAEAYRRDIDDFYSSHPACLKEDLDMTVYRLIQVWQGQSTYEFAASKCK
jgi:hypothetical protein